MGVQPVFENDHEEDADLSELDRGDEVGEELEDEVEDAPVAPEPESELEPEPEPAPEPAPEPPPKQENRIPKSRFDEVNERRKAAERRAQELEARLAQHDPSRAAQFDFVEAERKYMDAVIDGRTDEALYIRQEIRAAEQAAFTTLAEQRANQARESTKAELEFDAAVAELNTTYPVFDPEADSYSQELVDEVLDLHAGFVSRGYSPAAALRKAATYVARANGLGTTPEAPRTLDQAPRAKKPDVAKKLDMAAKQPPSQAGRSAASEDTMDVDSMSEEEFDALPAATLRRLRGDI